MKTTPDTKLKRPLNLIYNGEMVQLFRHEKGFTSCTVVLPDGTPEVADLCDLELVGKERKGIVNKPKVLTGSEKAFKQGLNQFFDAQIEMIPADCEECGAPLIGYHSDELRGIIAHILPKSPNSGFPGVATHQSNRMFLGTKCGCHSHYDNGNADDRIKMNIYFEAVKRFSEFADQLNERELNKAYKYLGIK
jgi:hypothetical protein